MLIGFTPLFWRLRVTFCEWLFLGSAVVTGHMNCVSFPLWSYWWLLGVPSQMKTTGKMTIRMRETGQAINRHSTHRMTLRPILLSRSGSESRTLVGVQSSFAFTNYVAFVQFLVSSRRDWSFRGRSGLPSSWLLVSADAWVGISFSFRFFFMQLVNILLNYDNGDQY